MLQSAEARILKVLVSKEHIKKKAYLQIQGPASKKEVAGKSCFEIMATDKSNTNMALQVSS